MKLRYLFRALLTSPVWLTRRFIGLFVVSMIFAPWWPAAGDYVLPARSIKAAVEVQVKKLDGDPWIRQQDALNPSLKETSDALRRWARNKRKQLEDPDREMRFLWEEFHMTQWDLKGSDIAAMNLSRQRDWNAVQDTEREFGTIIDGEEP